MADGVPTVGHDADNRLFVKGGAPVRFCLHKSVTQGRGRIARNVERNGGQIVVNERFANVLIIDEQLDLGLFRRRYYSSTELYRHSLYIEPRGFVQACIRSGTYEHVGPVRQRMPGPAPSLDKSGQRQRVSFTEEDRDHLAYYLATRCPTRDGRMGNSAYKDLERLGQTGDSSWKWARRHTFHSWREHYKMNPEMMDVRINHYLRQLRGVGHHFGHDLRSRDPENVRGQRQEEEEEEEEAEVRGRGMERQGPERQRDGVQQRPLQTARERPKRSGKDLVVLDHNEEEIQEEEEEGADDAVPEPQHAKRRRIYTDSSRQYGPRDVQEEEEDIDIEDSLSVEGSDLFGDRKYDSDFDDTQYLEFPIPSSPKAQTGSVLQQDGPPLSTQKTLVSSPRFTEKESSPAPVPTSTGVAVTLDEQVSTLELAEPPSSQRTLVMTQEHVIVPLERVRGVSAQPGSSMSEGTKAQGGAMAMDAPYRNTRARSRSVEPWSQADIDSQPPRQHAGKGKKGKKKAKGKERQVPASVEENIQAEEEQTQEHREENPGRISVVSRHSAQDEILVEELLEERRSQEGEYEEDEDNDDDVLPDLPQFQEIEIESRPSDSDDAETHELLVQGVVQEGSTDGDESRSAQDQDEDEEARIEQMAKGTLMNHAALAPADHEPRATHSMEEPRAQTQKHSQISPRRMRSRNQARVAPQAAAFPSPGTKARALVDRFQKRERGTPYAPPVRSRAARAVKEKR